MAEKLDFNIKDSGIRFNLSDEREKNIRDLKYSFGYSDSKFGEIVYHRTYSRLKEDGKQENWYDTVIRVINGIFTIRKWWFTFHNLPWDEAAAQERAHTMASHMLQMLWLPPGRGLWAGGTDYIYERGSMALYNCFDGNTHFYTKEHGSTSLKELVGQEITCWTRKGWKSATVNNYGKQNLNEIEFKPCVVTNSKTAHRITIRATSNHKWILSDNSITTELKPGDCVKSESIKSLNINENGLRHGYIFADGSLNWKGREYNRYHIRLCGNKKEKSYLFDNITSPESIGEDVYGRINTSPDINLKELPNTHDLSYIASFLSAWIEFDGYESNNGSLCLDTIDVDAYDYLVKYAPLIGYTVTGFNVLRNTTNFGERSKPLNRIKMRPSEKVIFRVQNIKENVSHEDVYCLEVPNEHEFTLTGGILTGNCAYVEVKDLKKDIAWLMDALMCGCGVGFGISDKPQELFRPYTGETKIYQIPDSREGWVESVRRLLNSYLDMPNAAQIQFDYSKIRGYGAPIKGFGGTSSGPEPLKVLHQRIRLYCNEYLEGKINWTHLTANLANSVGVCVVAGNVRRSAEICLGSPVDDSFVNLKNYEMYPDRNSIGWMSNNSCRLITRNDFLKLNDIAHRVIVNGEPGIYNALNVQKYARYGDESYGIDPATGINPCGEIPLESYELCNLSEVFPSRCSSRKEFLNALADATFYSSTISLYPTHSPSTNEVLARNRRIGVSLSGIAEWIDTWGIARCTRWLKDGYHLVRETNKQVNQEAGVPPSIRVTTVKPSGTISQLAGVPSGMHFPTFQHAIRRIIVDSGSPLANILTEAGYPCEPTVEFLTAQEAEGREYFGKYERFRPSSDMAPYMSNNSYVFECPIEQGQARPAKEVSAWEQFALLAMLQREWSDNSVSCTISFDPETEANQIPQMLTSFVPVIKSVSMLPHSDNGVYPQMPYEAISTDEYNRRIQELKPIDWSHLNGSDGNQSFEMYCSNDKCEIILK